MSYDDFLLRYPDKSHFYTLRKLDLCSGVLNLRIWI
jgi:hypothetical protein